MPATITDTQGIIAIAAAAVAVLALIGCSVLMLSVRRLRRAQLLVLGEDGKQDLVAHAARVQDAFEALRTYVDDVAVRLDGRLAGVEGAMRGTIAHRALVRYDAYNELSGHQSVSIALLDEEQSGIVLSCIHHRDQARVYAKQVTGGRGELELSPEEAGGRARRPLRPRPPETPSSSPPEMSPRARARVGYLGPAGTFSEEALLSSALPGTVEPVAVASIHDAVVALGRGEVEWAIVPIENALEGSISVTLDLLADEQGDVEIVGEALLRVRHSLIAAAPVELAEIDTVLTHPQVPGQCTRFLHSELAQARIVPAPSTAEAVRTVTTEPRPGLAALGTVIAAGIYGGTVLREGVEDRGDNETRFVWLARGLERARGLHSWPRWSASGRPRSSSGAPAPRVRAGWSAAWTSSRAGTSTSRRSSLGRAASDSATTCSSPTWPVARG